MKLSTAVARFVEQLRADGRSPSTVDVYGRELGRFAEWHGRCRPVERIRPPVLAKYLTSSACEGGRGPRGNGRRSTRTLNRARSALRQFFRYLEEAGTIRRSPARVIRSARIDPPIPVALSDEEVRRFRHVLDVEAEESDIGRRDRVLFTLLLRSGMRLAAALALDVEHLDLTAGTAVTNGKHNREQRVVLPRDVVNLLRRHLKETGVTTGAVFRTSRGRLSARQAQYRFHALIELAGIARPLTVHSLRHSFATRLRERTGDLRIVQAALGHRQLSTTEVYAHVGEEEVRRAVV
jgi:integrase/recombinase XerC